LSGRTDVLEQWFLNFFVCFTLQRWLSDLPPIYKMVFIY